MHTIARVIIGTKLVSWARAVLMRARLANPNLIEGKPISFALVAFDRFRHIIAIVTHSPTNLHGAEMDRCV